MANLVGFLNNTYYKIKEYPYNVEQKVGKNGDTYSNADLLSGETPMKFLNKTDRNLIMHGRIQPPKGINSYDDGH